MKIHKVAIKIVDHDELGAENVKIEMENVRYPNRCLSPRVVAIETVDVEWRDDHPLNRSATAHDEFARLFPSERAKAFEEAAAHLEQHAAGYEHTKKPHDEAVARNLREKAAQIRNMK